MWINEVNFVLIDPFHGWCMIDPGRSKIMSEIGKNLLDTEPKATMTVDEFLESDFLTDRGCGRKRRSPMEKLLTGSDGQLIKCFHIYADRNNLAELYSEIPAEVKIIRHPSIANGEIYRAQL